MKEDAQKPIREARKKIAEVRKDGAESLLLMNMKLRELPRQIAELPKVKSLGVPFNSLSSLGPAVALQQLTSLSLSENPFFNSLDELKAFPNLVELMLSACHIRDLATLPVLPKLEKIDLSDNRITDISRLAEFPSLNRIIINGNSIRSLRPLQSLLERGIEIYGKWSLAYSFADRYVYFKGNPLVDPPYAIAREGAKATLRYWSIQAENEGIKKPNPVPAAAPPVEPAEMPEKRPDIKLLTAVKQAKTYVVEDQLWEAIKTLRRYFPHPELLEARLRELETEVMEGTVAPEEASRRRAQIRKAILLAAGKAERGENAPKKTAQDAK